MTLPKLILFLWLAASAFAQSALKFEVATVKLADPNAAVRNQMLRISPTRMSIPSMTLIWMIYTAYGEGMNTSATVTGGPDWANRTAYAVEGLAPEPAHGFSGWTRGSSSWFRPYCSSPWFWPTISAPLQPMWNF